MNPFYMVLVLGSMQQHVDELCVLLLSQKSYIVALERSDPLFVQRTLSLDMQYNPWQRVMVQVAPELASYWLAFKKDMTPLLELFSGP